MLRSLRAGGWRPSRTRAPLLRTFLAASSEATCNDAFYNSTHSPANTNRVWGLEGASAACVPKRNWPQRGRGGQAQGPLEHAKGSRKEGEEPASGWKAWPAEGRKSSAPEEGRAPRAQGGSLGTCLVRGSHGKLGSHQNVWWENTNHWLCAPQPILLVWHLSSACTSWPDIRGAAPAIQNTSFCKMHFKPLPTSSL